MNNFKRVLATLCAGLFGITLFSMAWAHVGLSTIHNKDAVKGWFSKSDFYNQIVDVALEKAKASAQKSDTSNKPIGIENKKSSVIGSLPIKDPEIQSVAKQAFSPTLIKSSVESLLNGSYNWLDGSSKEIDFKVDLTAAKDQLVTGLGTYVTNRVAKLPVCPSNQISQDFDGFTATCRPSFLSSAQAGSEFRAEFLKQDFLKDPILTSDSLKIKNENGTEIPLSADKNVATVKDAYSLSNQLPFVLGLLAAMFAIGIMFLSIDKLRGVRRIGYVLTVVGVLLLVIYVGLGLLLSQNKERITLSGTNSPLQTKLLLDFSKTIIDDIKNALLKYITAYIVLGALCQIIAYVFLKRQVTKLNSESKENTHVNSSPIMDTDAVKSADEPQEKV